MKLSEISYSDLLFCSNDKKESIVFDTDYEKVTEPCDYGIVVGGISAIPYTAQEALRLYQEGMVKTLMLTGDTDKDKVPVAIKLYEFLSNAGVPDKDMLLQVESNNVFENIKRFLEIIQNTNDLQNAHFAVISSDIEFKRFYGMVTKLMEGASISGFPVKDGNTDLEHWKHSLLTKKLVLSEALLLAQYAKSGMVEDEDILERGVGKGR